MSVHERLQTLEIAVVLAHSRMTDALLGTGLDPRSAPVLAQGSLADDAVSAARIVIASERLSVCQVLAAALADAGHRVTMLRSGLAVFDELDGPPVDVFILCTSLTLSVDELCRAIRARSHARIVVVALTAETADVVAAFKAGVDDFVVGMPEPEELRRRVEALLRGADRSERDRR